jgi:DNA-damage-inducible protein D
VLERAKQACAKAGLRVSDHFRDVTEMVSLGSGANREIEDCLLTRYASYLVAQNGDPRKKEIAFAQTYFAVQTRKQELIEARLADQERIHARHRLAASEMDHSGVIFERLGDEESFARIRSRGGSGLFGGRSTHNMKERLGVPPNRPLADFLPTIMIKAKDLANEMTTLHVRESDLRTERSISIEHVANNRELRAALGRRGIRPEEPPPAEDVARLERRTRSAEQRLSADSESFEPA